MRVLLRSISDLRSRGEESRDEKTIAGLEFVPELSSELFVDMAVIG